MTFTADPTSSDCSVIQRLPDHLINQIAAGEVIERPASVIKELVENSLDAGSTRVEIFLSGGGIQEIQVLDNGTGISRLDLLKTAERHATSKVRQESDLEAIATFGFRGEALSSIASVAHLTLRSRKANSSSGFGVSFSKGIPEKDIEELSSPIGTQVIVKDLFKWVPARFKFLRSSSTELSYCQRIVRELALGNPHVRFYLKHEGRSLGSWITENRKDRFLECLKVGWKPLEVRNKRDDIELEAYFAPFQEQTARAELFLFINGRPVKNRPFLSAIRSVFSDHFGPQYEPIGVCYLDIRKDWVDVNVHPQKWEVRCLQQDSIYQWLLTTLREQLGLTRSPSPFSQHASASHSFPSPTPHFSLRFIAQTSQVLICENESGLILADIDQLFLTKLKRQILENGEQSESNAIILSSPQILHFSDKQTALISQYQRELKNLGFDFESYGDNDFVLRSCPAFVTEATAGSAFQTVAEHLSNPEVLQSKDTLVSIILEKASPAIYSNFMLLEELELLMKTHPELPQKGVVQINFEDLKTGAFKS